MTKRSCLAAVLAFALLGPAALPARAQEIVVGIAAAQTGFMISFDGEGAKMAKLWVDQMNAKGGLLGQKLKYVEADTKSDRTEGAKAGQAVLREGAKLVIVSCDYDYGAPAALQAQRAGVIAVSICAGDIKMGVIGVGPLAFSASSTAQSEGAALAIFSAETKKFTSAYILLDDSVEYDKSLCAGFEWMFPLKGGRIAGKDTFKNADPSIASQITRLSGLMKTEKVDEIILCSYIPGGPSALRQLRAAGIDLPVMTGVGMDGIFWLNSVPGLKEFYVAVQASIFSDPRPAVVTLADAFKAKYGAPPVNQHAYPIYAWLELWAKAVTKVGTTDAKAVVAELETYKREPTSLGPRSFSKELHIQAALPLVINQITEGTGKVVAEIEVPDIPRNVLYRLPK